MSATIALLVNPLSGQEFNLARYSVSIGREIGNDVVLSTDKTISRQHAIVHHLNGEYFLEDLNSKNGSRVNGNPVKSKTSLSSGDEVCIGITRLVFLLVPEKLQIPEAEPLRSARTETVVEAVVSGARTI
jgi:pSer/pThr/pTyr-binding forkhead associated (FHA) protein